MEERTIVADPKQEEITRLALTVAAMDGAIAVLFIVFPLLALGETAWTERFFVFIVPCCAGMFLTSLWFVRRLRQIQGS
jgi:hypothetical protein